MKRSCPQCGEQYDPHVSFCFVDGTPLGEEAPSEPAPAAVPRRPAGASSGATHEPPPRPIFLPPPPPPPSMWWVSVSAAAALAAWWGLSRSFG